MITTNDIVEVTFGCSADSKQLGLNRIFYFCRASVAGGLTEQKTADLMSALVAPEYKQYLCIRARYLGLRLRKVGVVPAPAVSSVAGAGDGLVNGSLLPPQTAMLFTKKTAAAGKIGRGRLYLPFWSEEDNLVSGIPNAGALVAGDTCAAVLLSNMLLIDAGASVDMVPCLAKASNGYIPLEITGRTQRLAWATQRRRSFINKGDGTFPPS